MSEEKARYTYRNVAIALGIVCLILIIGLVAAYATYTPMINSRDDTIVTKVNQMQTVTSEKDQLQTWLDGNKTELNTIIAERDQLQSWLDGNITYYNSQINSLNSQVANLQNQISSLNSQISSLNSQIESLESQIDSLKAPKLIKVNLRADDNRPWLGTPYLHVYGYICNVGSNLAYNCKLNVIAYQSGGVVAIDTYINLGAISGESWTSIDSDIYYSGSALTSWTITPEWTAEP